MYTKTRDLVILVSGSTALLAVLGSLAFDSAFDEPCVKMRTGALIGGIILMSIWGLTRLQKRWRS